MSSRVGRLFDGNVIQSARETVHELFTWATKLHNISSYCYGPHSNFLVIRNKAQYGHITITSSSGRVFRHVSLPESSRHIIIQLLKDCVHYLVFNVGDCGHFAVLLATKLVLTALGCGSRLTSSFKHGNSNQINTSISDIGTSLVTSANSRSRRLGFQSDGFASIPHMTVIAALELALKWTFAYLKNPKCPVVASVSWDDATQIKAVIKSLLLSKHICGLSCKSAGLNRNRLILRQLIMPPSCYCQSSSPHIQERHRSEVEELCELIHQGFLNSLHVDAETQTLQPNIHIVSTNMSDASWADNIDINILKTTQPAARQKLWKIPVKESSKIHQHKLLCNSLLLDIPLPPDIDSGLDSLSDKQKHKLQQEQGTSSPLRVVLYNISLRAPDLTEELGATVKNTQRISSTLTPSAETIGVQQTKPHQKKQHQIHNSASDTAKNCEWSSIVEEQRLLEQIGNNLLALQVDVVASQRLIHPWLKTFLLRHQILPLERLSLRHVGLFRTLTGCDVISRWTDTVQPDMLGAIRSLSLVRCNRTKRMLRVDGYSTERIRIMQQQQQQQREELEKRGFTNIRWYLSWAMQKWTLRRQDLSLLVLCSRNDVSAEELKHTVQRCITVLRNLVDQPQVVAGGGCVELHIAAHLRYRLYQQRLENSTKSQTSSTPVLSTTKVTAHEKNISSTIFAKRRDQYENQLGHQKREREREGYNSVISPKTVKSQILNRSQRHIAFVINAVAECFESVTCTLLRRSHRRLGFQVDMLENIMKANSQTLFSAPQKQVCHCGSYNSDHIKGNQEVKHIKNSKVTILYGWDATSQDVREVLRFKKNKQNSNESQHTVTDRVCNEKSIINLRHVESRHAKLTAIKSAIHTATALLRVGGTIVSRS